MIVSDHPKLSTLKEYEDELYIVDTESKVYDLVEKLTWMLEHGEEVKTPRRILRERGWDVTGKMYKEVIERVVA